jgi:hypothetical protein
VHLPLYTPDVDPKDFFLSPKLRTSWKLNNLKKWKQSNLTRHSNLQWSPQQSMTGSAKLLECKYPSRMGLLQRAGVCHQGKFSIVSFTTSVQILFIL